jgi:hypothetical protein
MGISAARLLVELVKEKPLFVEIEVRFTPVGVARQARNARPIYLLLIYPGFDLKAPQF